MVRCKFQCISIESLHSYELGRTPVKAVFEPRYDTSLPEDDRFTKATPSGRMEVTIDNPKALAELRVGRSYYLDLTPIPEEGVK